LVFENKIKKRKENKKILSKLEIVFDEKKKKKIKNFLL